MSLRLPDSMPWRIYQAYLQGPRALFELFEETFGRRALYDPPAPDQQQRTIDALSGDIEGLKAQVGRLQAEVSNLRGHNFRLLRRNAELEAIIGKDSHNSSRPPSSDPPWAKRTKSLRRHSTRRPGGQTGHHGETLRPSERPDRVVEHQPRVCRSGCVAKIGLRLLYLSHVLSNCVVRSLMNRSSSPFKWRHYAPNVILLCVRWYCRYQLSYRDVEEMMRERGLDVDHSTVFRWVQRYAPEINKRIRPHLKMSGISYRVDETYIKVGKSCKYLYRAVDKEGNTIEFMLSAKRDVSAAKRFFKKLMTAEHRRLPFSISVDKNAAYPEAFSASQEDQVVPQDCRLRRVKYLNNVIEQDHRFIKKKVRASQCFKRFHTAERTLEGIEAVNMMRKGQVKRLAGSDAQGQAKFVASLFQIAA